MMFLPPRHLAVWDIFSDFLTVSGGFLRTLIPQAAIIVGQRDSAKRGGFFS